MRAEIEYYRVNIVMDSPIVIWTDAIAPYNCLSNLKTCHIRGILGDHIFPSAEHYFAAHFVREDDRHMFAVGGRFSSFKDLSHYWKQRNMIGVLARMHMPYNPVEPSSEQLENISKIWHRVLRAKYEQHPDFRAILLSTYPHSIIIYEHNARETSVWSARYVCIDGEQPKIVGKNMMGQILSNIRDSFIVA